LSPSSLVATIVPITPDGEGDMAPTAPVATAVLVLAGLVPGVAQAGNDDFCAADQVCIYDGNDRVGHHEDANINVRDSDELSSWRTDGSCRHHPS
jgi:hypothetical protein